MLSFHFLLIFFQKVLLGNPAHSPTVVRTCSEHCEESVTDSTVTTCCNDKDLCNQAQQTIPHTPVTMLTTLLMGWLMVT